MAFSPGGTNDILARLVGQRLSEAFGQSVIVDNRPGAGGNIGSDLVAKAASDGYTLLLGSPGPHTINPNLYPRMPYDPVNDFTPITLVATSSALLVVHPSVTSNSVQELIALAKSGKRHLNFASSGNGSSPHLAGELFNSMAGVQMTHIPYKGNGPALIDVIAGQVEIMFANKPGALPFVKMGKLKVIAVASAKRDPAMPRLPTVAETLPGYEATGWWGILGPAGMPKPIVERLHKVLVAIVASPDTREKMSAMGAEPLTNTPEEFSALIRTQLATIKKVVASSGMKLE